MQKTGIDNQTSFDAVSQNDPGAAPLSSERLRIVFTHLLLRSLRKALAQPVGQISGRERRLKFSALVSWSDRA